MPFSKLTLAKLASSAFVLSHAPVSLTTAPTNEDKVGHFVARTTKAHTDLDMAEEPNLALGAACGVQTESGGSSQGNTAYQQPPNVSAVCGIKNSLSSLCLMTGVTVTAMRFRKTRFRLGELFNLLSKVFV